MSHIVSIQTEVTDIESVKDACARLGLPAPVVARHQLFSDSANGIGVQLNGWKYPAVFDQQSGACRYDNYNGNWGDQARLGEFVQAYAVCRAKREARAKGYRTTERQLDNGKIELRISC